jgi:hypothetical protein
VTRPREYPGGNIKGLSLKNQCTNSKGSRTKKIRLVTSKGNLRKAKLTYRLGIKNRIDVVQNEALRLIHLLLKIGLARIIKSDWPPQEPIRNLLNYGLLLSTLIRSSRLAMSQAV